MIMFYPWFWTLSALIAVSDARPGISSSGLECYGAKSFDECMTEPWYGVQPCAWCMANTGQSRCGIPSELILETGCPANMIKTNIDSKIISDKVFDNRQTRSSQRCNGVGSYNDGLCTCQPGRSGPHCECEGDLADYSAACMAPNSTSDELCSGRGECVCGYCNCFTRRPNSAQKYSGQYCQCDDYSCPYYNDQLCGGNGVCSCGHCSCMEGYIGDACELGTSNESCIATNGKLCNGVGTCLGSLGCQCDPATSHRGPTCEE